MDVSIQAGWQGASFFLLIIYETTDTTKRVWKYETDTTKRIWWCETKYSRESLWRSSKCISGATQPKSLFGGKSTGMSNELVVLSKELVPLSNDLVLLRRTKTGGLRV